MCDDLLIRRSFHGCFLLLQGFFRQGVAGYTLSTGIGHFDILEMAEVADLFRDFEMLLAYVVLVTGTAVLQLSFDKFFFMNPVIKGNSGGVF